MTFTTRTPLETPQAPQPVATTSIPALRRTTEKTPKITPGNKTASFFFFNVNIIRKDPDAGKDCSQEEKGVTEDEMVGWHH